MRSLYLTLGLVRMQSAAASIWIVTKFSYTLFGVCLSYVSWKVSNLFLNSYYTMISNVTISELGPIKLWSFDCLCQNNLPVIRIKKSSLPTFFYNCLCQNNLPVIGIKKPCLAYLFIHWLYRCEVNLNSLSGELVLADSIFCINNHDTTWISHIWFVIYIYIYI